MRNSHLCKISHSNKYLQHIMSVFTKFKTKTHTGMLRVHSLWWSGYYYYYYYNVLRPSCTLSGTTRVRQYLKGKTTKVKPIWIYWSKRKWVAVASVGPHANLHLVPDRQPCQHPTNQFFTGQMLFLPPNQQHQSTEGTMIFWMRSNICKNL